MDGEILKVLASIEKNSVFSKTHLRSLHDFVKGMTPAEINKAVRRAEKLGLVTLTDSEYTRTYKRGKRTVTETIPTKLVSLEPDAVDTINLLKLLADDQEATVADFLAAAAAEEEAAESARIDAANEAFLASFEEAEAAEEAVAG